MTLGSFVFHPKQRELFRSGKLWKEWSKSYPFLFDSGDVNLVRTQAKLGFHFFEWLAAVLLFQSTGYLSLVEKCQFAKHKRKVEVVKKLGSPELNAALECPGSHRIPS